MPRTRPYVGLLKVEAAEWPRRLEGPPPKRTGPTPFVPSQTRVKASAHTSFAWMVAGRERIYFGLTKHAYGIKVEPAWLYGFLSCGRPGAADAGGTDGDEHSDTR
jgi:hypothetical protein